MHDVVAAGTGFFWLAVGVGVLVMFLSHPTKANALIAAGPATIDGIIHGLESGKLGKPSQ